MTEEQWDALVRRIEPLAREDPKRYRLRVGLLGALGYAYIAIALFVLAALAVLVVALAISGPGALIKLIVPIAALGWIILRSLWVKIEPPEGIELKRDDAPELFEMLDEVRAAVDGPKLHRVLVDSELNAGIVQVPRLGPLGWQRNYLVIGLPLVEALTPDEFRAVIAHEMGHLSKRHGRFSAWVYRVRATWFQLLSTLEEKRHWGSALFRRFFEWYVPYFNAYSFVLMRSHEFEADKAAAEAAGPRAAGSALTHLRFAGRVLDTEYWPEVYGAARKREEPPEAAFTPLTQVLPAVRARKERKRWLRDELELAAETTDTHPSLADRLQALGVDPDELIRPDGERQGESAAQRYLGSIRDDLLARVDSDWRAAVLPVWREQWLEAEKGRARLQELRGQSSLGVDELREKAVLTEELDDRDQALPLYREVLEASPEDPQANFAVGRLLLARGDDGGLQHLERAMKNDPDAVLAGCEVAIGYLREQGRKDEAEKYRARGERHLELLAAAGEEREDLSVDDDLGPHDLSEELVERVRRAVETYDEVGSAYLVRKRLRHLDDEYPLYVIGLIPRHRWRQLWKEADDDGDPSLADRVADSIELPVDFTVVVPGPRSGIDERFEQIERAKIFSRR
jgi:Zn-dependent protease with chaperone function